MAKDRQKNTTRDSAAASAASAAAPERAAAGAFVVPAALRALGGTSSGLVPRTCATYGRQRADHGLTLTLDTPSGPSAGELDVLGSTFFAGLPILVSSVAGAVLPLAVEFQASDDGQSLSTTLGARDISAARIRVELEKLQDAGDVPFVLDFRNEADTSTPIALVPTKPSLVLRSLAADATGGCDIRCSDALDPATLRRRSHSLVLALLWWLKYALLFCVGCWALHLAPHHVLPYAPSLFGPGGEASSSSLASVLPVCPPNMTAAFELGQVYQQIVVGSVTASAGVAGAAESFLQPLLARAAALVGKAAVTVEQLAVVLDEIRRVESHVSLSTRVLGFFSFVNIVWLLAIVGIAISVGPTIKAVLAPFGDFMRRLAVRYAHGNEILVYLLF